MSRMNFHGPKDVRAIEVWLYFFLEYSESTLGISNSKGLTETLQDIRTSTYQSWESEKNNKLNDTFNKWICNLTPEVWNIYI